MRAKRITNTADRCSWRGERLVRAQGLCRLGTLPPCRLPHPTNSCSSFQISSDTTSSRKASSGPLCTSSQHQSHHPKLWDWVSFTPHCIPDLRAGPGAQKVLRRFCWIGLDMSVRRILPAAAGRMLGDRWDSQMRGSRSSPRQQVSTNVHHSFKPGEDGSGQESGLTTMWLAGQKRDIQSTHRDLSAQGLQG